MFNGDDNGRRELSVLADTGKTYFVNGSNVLVYDWQTDQLETPDPRPLTSLGLTGAFAQRIDAAVRGRGLWQNKLFFFSGSSYVQFDLETRRVDLGPTNLSGWRLPDAFQGGVDAAVNGEGKYLGKLYIFKGPLYARYSWNVRGDIPANWVIDRGYPGPIVDGWERFAEMGLGDRAIGAVNAGLS